jgi:hypothetical protein
MWDEKGTFDIKVKAKDIHGFEGEWSDPFSFPVPREKVLYRPILKLFLELIQKMFPILSNIIS